jgi:hypothetical protein
MPDYIDREAANLALAEQGFDWDKAKQALASVPAADVVPVVRCKDCENAQNECGGMIICRVYKHIMFLHDFCSYGKRKGGGADNG